MSDSNRTSNGDGEEETDTLIDTFVVRSSGSIGSIEGHALVARRKKPGTTSFVGAGATLLMSVVGAGLLSIPFAFRVSGLVAGLCILLVIAVAVDYSCGIILSCHRASGNNSFEEFARTSYGPKMAMLSQLLIVLATAGALVSYIVIIKEVLPSFIRGVAPAVEADAPIFVNAVFVAGLLFAVLVLPLCLLRNLSSLQFSSFFGLAFTLYVTALVVGSAASALADGSSCSYKPEFSFVQPQSWDALLAIPIFAFAFVMHLNIVPLFEELHVQSYVKMRLVLRCVTVICVLFYLLMGLMGFSLFCNSTAGNILKNWEQGDQTAWVIVAKGAVSLVVTVSFPLLLYPCRATLHALAFAGGSYAIAPLPLWVAETLGLVGLLFGLAILIPGVEVALTFTGSLFVGLICYILPALFYLRLDKVHLSPKRRVPIYVLLACSGVLVVVCTSMSVAHLFHNDTQ